MSLSTYLASGLLVVLILVSYAYYILYNDYTRLRDEYEELQRRNTDLYNKIEWANTELNLCRKYEDLYRKQVHDMQLQVSMYEVWLQGNSSLVQVYRSRYEQLLSKYNSIFEELSKLNETYYYRSFRLKDYRNILFPSEFTLHVWYPGSAYISFRLYAEHIKMVVEGDTVSRTVISYVKKAVRESIPIFRRVASDIMDNVAGGDREYYANLVLQIVHQLKYDETMYSKYPVETLVEGVGDCDCLSLLLATFLEAAGIDAILIVEKIDNGYHVRVGVNLPNQPDDPALYGRTSLKYLEYNGKNYYLAEATWNVTKYDPLDPSVIGFFVGDPVKTGQIIAVIDV